MFLLLATLGCTNQFGITSYQKPAYGDDTGADTGVPAVDTDEDPEDTASDDTGGDEQPDETGEDTAVEDSGGDSGIPVDTDEAVDDPAPEDDCIDTTDLIYALSRDDGTLYTFDPSTSRFTSLGRVNCGTSQSPGSMAVARDGVAYVRYADDRVYAVDLATMSCSATAYNDRTTHFDSFGMGFVTDSADTWREQLYVANGTQVGVLDTSAWTIRTLGSMPSQSELTGNADGELWAMLPLERPAQLRRIDTSSGAAAETIRLSGFPDPSNIDTFAFATWGGDFYLFVREYGMGESTDVYRATTSGTMTRVLDNVGFDVVGAGVSTCAPS